MSTEAATTESIAPSEAALTAIAQASTKPVSVKRRGSNRQKSRYYHAYSSPVTNRKIKKLTEAIKRFKGVARLTPSDKDFVVFFSVPLNSASSRDE